MNKEINEKISTNTYANNTSFVKTFKTIAVDFDGTLCYNKWPDLGDPNEQLIKYLNKWKEDGNKVILWTCRAGKALEVIVYIIPCLKRGNQILFQSSLINLLQYPL